MLTTIASLRRVHGLPSWPKTKFPGALPRAQIPQAHLRPVSPPALIQLLQRQITLLDLVASALHVLGILRRIAHDPASARRYADPKLPRGGFIVRIHKASPDARSICDMPHKFHPPVRIGANCRNDASTRRQ